MSDKRRHKLDVPTISAERIKALRVELGMTQAQLAECLGLAQATITRWETGSCRITAPHLKVLAALVAGQAAAAAQLETDRNAQRAEDAQYLASGEPPIGLAGVARQPLMTGELVILAASGHVLGTLKLDKERLMSLRLLGEYYGLWGAGRKPPGETPEKPEGFKVREQANLP